MSFGDFLANNLHQFWILTGFHNATWEHFVMLAVGLFFIWLAIKKDFEPMLLVPIGFGILIGNIPFNTTATSTWASMRRAPCSTSSTTAYRPDGILR